MAAVAQIRQKYLLPGVVLSVLSVFAFSLVTPAIVLADDVSTNNDTNVTTTETREALQDTGSVLAASDQLPVKTDADSAVVATVGGTTVDIPKDPEQGVTFGASEGAKLEIGLPNAEDAGNATKVANGVAAYNSGDGSANAVQATEDGGVRMLTVIDNPNAPTAYSYDVTVPGGGHIELTEEGGAVVLDASNQPVASVATPWAKDANDNPVQTYFTTDGQTLTQHVIHNVPGVAYPVTADPFWFVFSAGIFWWAVQRCGAGGIIGAVFEYVGGGRSGRAIAAAGAAGCIASFVGGWGILKNIVRIVRW